MKTKFASEIWIYQVSAVPNHQNGISLRYHQTWPNDNGMPQWFKESKKKRTLKMDADECATPFMVQRSPIVGRCLVASKYLSQGELIIRECPLGKLICN